MAVSQETLRHDPESTLVTLTTTANLFFNKLIIKENSAASVRNTP